ncbi:histidine kinase [Puia sp. P3]
MSMEHEFENLKGQINPHFLFNCFNTLSSLIEEDSTEAERFLGRT